MKKAVFLSILIFSVWIKAQNSNFVLLSDINYDGKKSEARLDSLINAININEELNFVVVAGNLTSNGSANNVNEAYTALQNFNVPFYVIPGPNDYMWSDNGGIIFNEIWQENRFSFSSNKTRFIGLNTSVINGSKIGHFFPEDLEWLGDELSNCEESDIILIFHHNLDKIDNKHCIYKLFPENKNIAVLCGEQSKDLFKKTYNLEGYNKFNFENIIPNWQYSVIKKDTTHLQITECTNDSLLTNNTEISLNKYLNKQQVDSSEFLLYSAESVWGRNISETMIAEPLIVDKKIITATYSGIVTCFDSLGTVLWDYDIFGNITSKPAIINNILIVATLQGDLITINMEDGAQLQSIGFDESITSELATYDYTGKKELMTITDNSPKHSVIFGTSSGKIYCYLVETLEEIWVNKKASSVITSKPFIHKNKIVFSAWDGRIYCIDSRDGLLIWKYRMTKDRKSSPARCFPVADNKYIYFTSADGSLIKLDLRLGSKIWVKKKYNANSSIGISLDKKRLYVKSTNGRFHVLSALNGNWVREIIPRFSEDFSKSTIFERDDIVPFSSQNGDVYRINNKYYYKKLLNIGPADIHSVQPFIKGSWIVSNKDGKVVRFIIE